MESDQRLLHVFTTNFTALDIAESLPMFDEGVPIEDVEKSLNAHQVIGVSPTGSSLDIDAVKSNTAITRTHVRFLRNKR